MIIQIIGVILAIIGFFIHVTWLFFVGGFVCLMVDIVGFTSGKLKPMFPIVLYLGGYLVVGNWTGILAGSVIGSLIDVIPMLIGMSFLSFKKEDDERKN